MTRDVAEEGLGKIMHEIDVSTFCIESKVDGVMNGRYIAFDEGLGIVAIIGKGLDSDLLGFFIPVGFGVEYAHATLLELELLDLQIGVRIEVAKELCSLGATCGLTTKLYAVEVYQIEDISYLYLI